MNKIRNQKIRYSHTSIPLLIIALAVATLQSAKAEFRSRQPIRDIIKSNALTACYRLEENIWSWPITRCKHQIKKDIAKAEVVTVEVTTGCQSTEGTIFSTCVAGGSVIIGHVQIQNTRTGAIVWETDAIAGKRETYILKLSAPGKMGDLQVNMVSPNWGKTIHGLNPLAGSNASIDTSIAIVSAWVGY